MGTREPGYADCIDFLMNLDRALLIKKKRSIFMHKASVRRDVIYLRDNFINLWMEENGTYRISDSALSLSCVLTIRGLFGNYDEASSILDIDRKVAFFERSHFREFLEDHIASTKARDNLFTIICGDGESLRSLALLRIMFLEPCISVIKKIDIPEISEVRLEKRDIDSLWNVVLQYREIENSFTADIGLHKKFFRDFRSLYRDYARIDIIGYGEISTVMRMRKSSWSAVTGNIEENDSRWIWKKMPPFPSLDEVERFSALYQEYRKILIDEIGIAVPEQMVRQFQHKDHFVVYAGQEMADERAICNKLIKRLNMYDARMILEKILKKLHDVHRFNANNGRMKIGIDAQLSNWVLIRSSVDDAIGINDSLIYIDTSSPLIRIHGVERLNPEIFIKSAASFLRPVIRTFFLAQVLDRYYDIRSVIIDIIANLYKEKREDLIDSYIETANSFIQTTGIAENMVSRKEIDSYYSNDAFIWKFYQASRKLDRFVTERILHKKYAFRIPVKIER